MLIAYFDESGHSRQTDFVSMTACVGRYDQWKPFDQQWNAALSKHNVPYLHMREYAHSLGPYEGWKEPQRRGLMADCLAAVTASRLVFAAACVRVTDFINLEPEIRAEIADPYYACFQELDWYFRGRRGEVVCPSRDRDLDLVTAARRFGAARFEALYRAWQQRGDDALHTMQTPFLRDQLQRGTGCIEFAELPHQYLQLTPLVGRSYGVEKALGEGDNLGTA